MHTDSGNHVLVKMQKGVIHRRIVPHERYHFHSIFVSDKGGAYLPSYLSFFYGIERQCYCTIFSKTPQQLFYIPS
ncbi:hypothetical protein [Treponema vincentii]|uniref:hypothetical protein n=1 Tax=Treponema vincentii TaxID=69710 RepID=UPI0020A602B7|nr:hypothetical protein [Treponema vincentii]UTC47751.1 hypothetical protein E4N73_02295 [Treponema vincentii]